MTRFLENRFLFTLFHKLCTSSAIHSLIHPSGLSSLPNRTLLELGASPNYRDVRGITPLYLSVTKKADPKISESLLHDHASLGIQDSQGWQEIHQVRYIRLNRIFRSRTLIIYLIEFTGLSKWIGAPFRALALLLRRHERTKCIRQYAPACVRGEQPGGMCSDAVVSRGSARVLELRQPDTVSGMDGWMDGGVDGQLID